MLVCHVEFFHRCIMMSGTDLSASLFVNSYWRPRDYAHELADLLDCYTDDTYRMMQCMRKVDWRRLLDLQELVEPKVRCQTSAHHQQDHIFRQIVS